MCFKCLDVKYEKSYYKLGRGGGGVCDIYQVIGVGKRPSSKQPVI